MIKEAGFLWSAATGNLLFCFLPSLLLCFFASCLLCFLPSLLLCLLLLLVSLAEFLYLVSGISAGFLWDFSRLFDYPQKRG